MDYFSIIVLIIATFIFISDKKVKSIKTIQERDNSIMGKASYIADNMQKLIVDLSAISIEELNDIISKTQKEYIFIQNKLININKRDVKCLVANFVDSDEKACGFNINYKYVRKDKKNLKDVINRLYIVGINYLNVFDKTDISSYGAIILKKQTQYFVESKNMVSYTPNGITQLKMSNISINEIKNIYLDKLRKGSIIKILKIALLLFSGTTITANLIYSIINLDIYSILLSSVMYYCYTYIINYMYKAMGKHRIIASYLFPIYFLAFLIISIITAISEARIKNV